MKPTVAMLLSNPLAPDPRVRKEAAFLSDSGFNVTVYAWDRQAEHPRWEETDGFVIRRIPVHSTYGNWLKQMVPLMKFARRVASLCKEAHIIHAHDLEMLPVALWLARRLNAPVVFDAHEPTYFADAQRLRSLATAVGRLGERMLAPRASAVLATTGYQIDKYAKLGINRVIPVPNYPERWLFEAPMPHRNTDSITIGRIGAMPPDAGIEELLNAADLLRPQFPQLQVFLVGSVFPGYLPRLQDRVNSHQVRSTFLPQPYNYQDLLQYYSKLDICVMPQKPTAWFQHIMPVKFFEAMAFGRPVVTTDIGDIGGIVAQERCGTVIAEVSAEGIAEALRPLLENSQLRRQMGTNAREAVRQRYNWDVATSRLYEVYQELLSA